MENNATLHTEELTIGEPVYVGQPTNPMDENAMRFIYNLGKQSRDYTVQEINGGIYVNTGDLTLIEPEIHEPESFLVRTLTGLVEWLKEDVDKLREIYPTLYVSVTDTNKVRVLSPLIEGAEATRYLLAFCDVEMPEIHLNTYMPPEEFVIMLQTHFCEGENRDGVLALAGNLRMDQDAQTADDGMSQRITVRQGIATVGEATVKNPVMLAPHRTFHEVAQPSSPFILRFKKEGDCPPGVALYEADGGAWKIDAIVTVGNWLKEQLKDLNIVVIA